MCQVTWRGKCGKDVFVDDGEGKASPALWIYCNLSPTFIITLLDQPEKEGFLHVKAIWRGM